MRRGQETTETTAHPRDFTIPAGCMLCGGDLDVRMAAAEARSVCKACHWISRPMLRREEDGIAVIHPAAGLA